MALERWWHLLFIASAPAQEGQDQETSAHGLSWALGAQSVPEWVSALSLLLAPGQPKQRPWALAFLFPWTYIPSQADFSLSCNLALSRPSLPFMGQA